MAPAGKIASACTEHMPLPGHRTMAEVWAEEEAFRLRSRCAGTAPARTESPMKKPSPHTLSNHRREELELLERLRAERQQ